MGIFKARHAKRKGRGQRITESDIGKGGYTFQKFPASGKHHEGGRRRRRVRQIFPK